MTRLEQRGAPAFAVVIFIALVIAVWGLDILFAPPTPASVPSAGAAHPRAATPPAHATPRRCAASQSPGAAPTPTAHAAAPTPDDSLR